MRAILTPDDLKKGEIIAVGWHPLEITGYEEKPADSDGSTNCIFQFKVIDGPEKGKSANKLFNEKALGFGKKLWEAVGIPKNQHGGYDLSTEVFQQMIGKKVKGYNKVGKSNKGNEFNDLADFQKM